MLKWLGNLIILNKNRVVKKIFDNKPEGRRKTGRPSLRWWRSGKRLENKRQNMESKGNEQNRMGIIK